MYLDKNKQKHTKSTSIQLQINTAMT